MKLIKESKKLNYEKIIDEGKNQPATIWKMFNELGAGKRKSNSANSINSLKVVTLCAQLLLQFYFDSFETLQIS